LGCTLTFLITGHPPFPGTGAEVLTRHLTQPPPSLRRRVADVPPALDALVQKLLAKDPARRGDGAGKVAAELEAIARSSGRSRTPGALAIVALVVLLAGLGAGTTWAITRVPPAPPRVPPPPPRVPPPPPPAPAPAPALAPGAKPGEFVLAKDGSVFVRVPEAVVVLGANDDCVEAKPEYRVALSSYFISKYKVTTKQFSRFVAATGYKTRAERTLPPYPPDDGDTDGRFWWWEGPRLAEGDERGIVYVPETTASWLYPLGKKRGLAGDRDPVLQVTWDDAMMYAEWAGATLPSESQWECAARWDPATGKTRRYPWGDDPPEENRARFVTLGATRPVTVGPVDEELNVSPVGAVQMAGNAREWVRDEFTSNHGGFVADPPLRDPVATYGGTHHTTKGGSWREFPRSLSGAFRQTAVGSDDRTTFRLALEVR
ncbi:MAG TPA: SUMF1/EgtB/PvdO family nonheme iron enzyme, partial [Planctomycetota bacterium]|nr:SUMF1/EgtB/PvdO family nonheme iron enzyme [Planctomycetota bacterium]